MANYPFDDHNAPPFQAMKPYCDDMDEFLSADEKNVAIVHCKDGKVCDWKDFHHHYCNLYTYST